MGTKLSHAKSANNAQYINNRCKPSNILLVKNISTPLITQMQLTVPKIAKITLNKDFQPKDNQTFHSLNSN